MAKTRFSDGCLPGHSTLGSARPSGFSCDGTVLGKPQGIPADRVLLQVVALGELGCTGKIQGLVGLLGPKPQFLFP